MKKSVTLIKGDGIGPEVVESAQRVIAAAGVDINWEVCEAGAAVFKKGLATGIPQETIDSLLRTGVLLKGPLETPVGYGEKSANVTLRALAETYANVRPVQTLPGIHTPFSDRKIDFVVVRENLEDLYAGIEYLQTPTVAEGIKLITRQGSEKIIRFAFELARAEGRHKVHCATKANILKLTEGLFKRVFEDVSGDYPDIESHHIIVDNCAHQLVVHPENFDVIVTTNLQGDILSDLASGLIGGLGVAPSANLGDRMAIFEAVHGSAPKYAGKNVINPTALLFTAILMLRHLNEFEAAHQIEQSLLFTFGVEKAFTVDLDKISPLSTEAFTDRIIRNLGNETNFWVPRTYKPINIPHIHHVPDTALRTVKGIDVYIESALSAEALGKSLEEIALPSPFILKMISSRSVQVYPPLKGIRTEEIHHWRARFFIKETANLRDEKDILDLLNRISQTYRWMQVEKLYEFDGVPGFTQAQGEA
jgi:isocitrate dehydrogenase